MGAAKRLLEVCRSASGQIGLICHSRISLLVTSFVAHNGSFLHSIYNGNHSAQLRNHFTWKSVQILENSNFMKIMSIKVSEVYQKGGTRLGNPSPIFNESWLSKSIGDDVTAIETNEETCRRHTLDATDSPTSRKVATQFRLKRKQNWIKSVETVKQIWRKVVLKADK